MSNLRLFLKNLLFRNFFDKVISIVIHLQVIRLQLYHLFLTQKFEIRIQCLYFGVVRLASILKQQILCFIISHKIRYL